MLVSVEGPVTIELFFDYDDTDFIERYFTGRVQTVIEHVNVNFSNDVDPKMMLYKD